MVLPRSSSVHTSLTDDLGLAVGVEAFRAAFVAETAVLHSTERCLRQHRRQGVNADSSGFKAIGDILRWLVHSARVSWTYPTAAAYRATPGSHEVQVASAVAGPVLPARRIQTLRDPLHVPAAAFRARARAPWGAGGATRSVEFHGNPLNYREI